MSDAQMRMDKDEKIGRKSVVGPAIVRVNGQRTKATSSKVDRTANEPRTKMVDDFQMQGLKMSKKIYTATCLPSVSCRWSPCKNMRRHTSSRKQRAMQREFDEAARNAETA